MFKSPTIKPPPIRSATAAADHCRPARALGQLRRTPWLLALLCVLGSGPSHTQPTADAAAPIAPTSIGAPGLPAGSIIAFVPQASGFSGTAMQLRGWLAERGWAICDGTNATPDLRDRLLIGTTEAERTGERLGSRDHDHRLRGDSGPPLLRNRHTRTGLAELKHIPDDQHRHRLDLASDRSPHLPPSTRVLFIMKLP